MLDFSGEQAAVELKGPRAAVIEEVKEGVSQTSGIGYLNVKFKIIDPKNTGMVIFHSFFWTKKDGAKNDVSVSQFASLLDASGTDRKLSSYQDILGKKAILNIVSDPQTGRANVRGFKKYNEPKPEDQI